MAAYLGEVNLIKFLFVIDEMRVAKEGLDEKDSTGLKGALEEAQALLAQIMKSLLTRDQPFYQVKVVVADEPQNSSECVLRLDKLVEIYPFLLEALVLTRLDEISFLDKKSLTAVQITKV